MSDALVRLLLSNLGRLPAARPLQPSLYSPVAEPWEVPQADVASNRFAHPPLTGPSIPEAALPTRELVSPQASSAPLLPPLSSPAETKQERQAAQPISSVGGFSGLAEARPAPAPEPGSEETSRLNARDLYGDLEDRLQAFKRELFSENRVPRLMPQGLPAHLPDGRPAGPAALARPRLQPPAGFSGDVSPAPQPKPEAPTINVHIGRVEVRAVSAVRPSPQRPAAITKEPALTLEEYLHARRGGGS